MEPPKNNFTLSASGDVAQALLPAGVETPLDPLASGLPVRRDESRRRRQRVCAKSAVVKLILRGPYASRVGITH